ncbi:polk-prov protein [Aphelenchoides avenae]|nr:polk-prov protein [Aphelenchus avenae]
MWQRTQRTKPVPSKEEIAKIIEENTTDKWKEKQRRDNAQRQAQIDRNQRVIDSLTEDDITAAQAEMDKIIEETEKERDFSRTKVHVDMDAFYASVEVRDDPKLRSQPVASTANYVARRYGVKSALAGYIAKKLCPQLVIVPCNFRKYIAVSDVVMAVLRDYDPHLSCPSLDEAYMDLTDYLKNRVEPAVLERIRYSGKCICRLPLVTLSDMPGERATRYEESCLKCHNIRTVVKDYVTFGPDVEEVVREMRFRVQQSTGLTCSAGIASNSRLAKICSDMNKPNGQYYLEPTREAVINFMRELPTRKVPGVGPVAEATLKAMGIETCGQLIDKRGILWRVLYPMPARWYMEVALGIKIHNVDEDSKTERTRKSIGNEETFRPCSRVTELEVILESLCEELAASLPRNGILGGKTVVLKIKYDNFELHTRSRTLGDVVGEKETMLAVVKKSLKEFLKNGEKA